LGVMVPVRLSDGCRFCTGSAWVELVCVYRWLYRPRGGSVVGVPDRVPVAASIMTGCGMSLPVVGCHAWSSLDAMSSHTHVATENAKRSPAPGRCGGPLLYSGITGQGVAMVGWSCD